MLLADLSRRHETGEAEEGDSPQGLSGSRASDELPRATIVSYGGSNSSASGFTGKGAPRGSVAASVTGPPAQSAGSPGLVREAVLRARSGNEVRQRMVRLLPAVRPPSPGGGEPPAGGEEPPARGASSSGLVREAVLRAESGDEVRHRMVRLRPAVRPPSEGGEDIGSEAGGASAAPVPRDRGIQLPLRWVQVLGRWERMARADPSASLRAWKAARAATASDATAGEVEGTAGEADATAAEEATAESTPTGPPCAKQEPEGSGGSEPLAEEIPKPVLVCV